MAKDGQVWMNQNQLSDLFDTSVQNINKHILNILEDKELEENSVINYYLITAADGKEYNVKFYSLDMLRVKNRKDLTLDYWRKNINTLLEFQDKEVLSNKGTISNKQMENIVRARFEIFNENRKHYEAIQADKDDFDDLNRHLKELDMPKR